MPSPTIELLLILQDRDTRRLGIEAQLKAVPGRSRPSSRGSQPKGRRSTPPRASCASSRPRRRCSRRRSARPRPSAGKYRTQQLAVKKNDEYQALGHEIENVQKQIDELEGRELEMMYAIDEARKRFAAAEATLKQNIAGHEARIRSLKEKEAQPVRGAQGGGGRGGRRPASRFRSRPCRPTTGRRPAGACPPWSPIRGGKCGGCHLKVSSEVESAARGKTADTRIRALRPVRADGLLGVLNGACGRARRRGKVAPLALGPGRRSKFFDPKARVTPRPIEVWRGKSGHRRAGCCTSRKASAGAAGQAAATDSVTENKPPGGPSEPARARVKRWGKSPPRPPRGGRHEKPLPVQDKIGDWAARPIVSGMSHPSVAARSAARRADGRAPQGAREK